MNLSIKDILKSRKKRLDTPPPKVEKSKKDYNRKNKDWKKDNGI